MGGFDDRPFRRHAQNAPARRIVKAIFAQLWPRGGRHLTGPRQDPQNPFARAGLNPHVTRNGAPPGSIQRKHGRLDKRRQLVVEHVVHLVAQDQGTQTDGGKPPDDHQPQHTARQPAPQRPGFGVFGHGRT